MSAKKQKKKKKLAEIGGFLGRNGWRFVLPLHSSSSHDHHTLSTWPTHRCSRLTRWHNSSLPSSSSRPPPHPPRPPGHRPAASRRRSKSAVPSSRSTLAAPPHSRPMARCSLRRSTKTSPSSTSPRATSCSASTATRRKSPHSQSAPMARIWSSPRAPSLCASSAFRSAHSYARFQRPTRARSTSWASISQARCSPRAARTVWPRCGTSQAASARMRSRGMPVWCLRWHLICRLPKQHQRAPRRERSRSASCIC